MRVTIALMALVIDLIASMGVRCDPEKYPNERTRWMKDITPAANTEGTGTMRGGDVL